MSRQNRRLLVLLGQRMFWQCRRLPERLGEKTCWPSHIRRRLATDTDFGTGVGHFAVGPPAACGAVGKTIGRTATGWRIHGQRLDRRDDIRDHFDKETFQAPSVGPLARRSTGTRRPWTHAAVGGTGGRGGTDQATLLWPLRSRFGRKRPASSAPPSHRHPAGASSGYRISVAYQCQIVGPNWYLAPARGGAVVGRLPAEHRDAVVRRLRHRPGARLGLSVGVGGDCRTGSAGPRLRAPTDSRPHRETGWQATKPGMWTVHRHSLAPRTEVAPVGR